MNLRTYSEQTNTDLGSGSGGSTSSCSSSRATSSTSSHRRRSRNSTSETSSNTTTLVIVVVVAVVVVAKGATTAAPALLLTQRACQRQTCADQSTRNHATTIHRVSSLGRGAGNDTHTERRWVVPVVVLAQY